MDLVFETEIDEKFRWNENFEADTLSSNFENENKSKVSLKLFRNDVRKMLKLCFALTLGHHKVDLEIPNWAFSLQLR